MRPPAIEKCGFYETSQTVAQLLTKYFKPADSGRLLDPCAGEGTAASILAKAFIYGRIVNARNASYLVKSDITLCCQPNYLCFASTQDALKFQNGFGGQIMTFDEARTALTADHQCLGDANHHH